ncbi:MAG: peptide chain release factor N(5)-glutamine methyltransferase [Gammaproteobacteria bacterium]|nr:peptide chain release factor N(5)-glutamine methyltransferase [Gammaproteobacteria bacterium]
MTTLSIAHCLQQSSQLAALSDTPRLDVEIILAHILQKTRTYLFAWPEKNLTEAEAVVFKKLFGRRLAGEPIAHIVGVREFWSLELAVNNTTLIPRPDTELLVETALALFANDAPEQPRNVLDLGTGSGAIVLALAYEKKSWQCVAVDKEINAVALAEKNRAQLTLTNVTVQQSDWFSTIASQTQFDLIVSNPPYIDPNDPHLREGDVRFEPLSALIANNQGFADLEFIITNAKNYLVSNGWLLLEHGYDQAAAVRKMFSEHAYLEIQTLLDLSGNDRVTMGKK